MGDHREAAAGLAGACGLDGRVQRQEVGLFGDRLDQVQHAIDSLGGCGEAFDLGDRLFGLPPGLFDRAGRLADLPADLFHGGGQLLGGAGDGGYVGGGLRGRSRRGIGSPIRIRRHPCDGPCVVAHRGRAVVDRADDGSDRLPEILDGFLDVPAACVARPRLLSNLRIEAAIMLHRLLEDPDRADQRADFVTPVGMGDLDILAALGDGLDGRGDLRQRPSDRAGDQDDTDDDQRQRNAAEAGQDQGQQAVAFRLLGNGPAAFGIDLGQRFEILVERGADRAIGVVVAPFAARGRIDFHRPAHQLLAEIDELLDALLEGGELFGIVSPNDRFPTIDDVEDLPVEFQQAVAELLGDVLFRRHVDAAGLHHDRIDQGVDPLDIQCGEIGSLDRLREFRRAARIVIGQQGDRGRQKREQAENGVQLGRERQAGRDTAGGSVMVFRHASPMKGPRNCRRPHMQIARARWKLA